MSKDDIQTANIGRKGTIHAAWIAFACGLVGAIAGAVTSVYITEKQISLGYQTVRLEYLCKELDKLEMLSRQLSEVDVYFKEDPQEAETQRVQLFQKVFRMVSPHSHLLSRDKWGKLQQVAFDLDTCITDARSDPSVLPKRWPSIASKMRDATLKALDEIEASKRTRQEEITRFTSLIGR